MGKSKKRIMKNLQGRSGMSNVNNLSYNDLKIDKIVSEHDVDKCRIEIKKLLEEKKYNAAMEKIISLFNAGHTDYDLMLDLAEIYYVNRDYQRAEKWAYNSIKIQETGKAYVLLAKIYSDNNATEKMAGALNAALKLQKDISDEDNELIGDMTLVVELSYDADIISQKYPYIAKKMEKDEADIDDVDAFTEDNDNNFQQDNFNDNSADKDEIIDDTETMMNSGSLQSAQMAADSIEQMINDELAGSSETAPEKPGGFEEHKIAQNTTSNDAPTINNKTDIEAIRDNILQENTSLVEKLKKLNAAAANCYFDNNLPASQMLLETAFSIDEYDEGTLRNLVQLSLRQNDKEKAFDYAIKMPTVDFMLLDKIKNE
ncbi:major capsid protein [Pectinatus sottacetonis]|uniref:hypothetical protein n=1 Tax=Pectinatus sottacetonis TaxID=1002795 RepID=UPI0018C479FD|nr:hypothetical protein [Pectinatus sottacetonis]